MAKKDDSTGSRLSSLQHQKSQSDGRHRTGDHSCACDGLTFDSFGHFLLQTKRLLVLRLLFQQFVDDFHRVIVLLCTRQTIGRPKLVVSGWVCEWVVECRVSRCVDWKKKTVSVSGQR